MTSVGASRSRSIVTSGTKAAALGAKPACTGRWAAGIHRDDRSTPSAVGVVGVGQDVLDELVVHREEFPPGVDGLLFRGPRGSLMTRQRRSETWRRYRHAIGGREGEGWH